MRLELSADDGQRRSGILFVCLSGRLRDYRAEAQTNITANVDGVNSMDA
jgi:hypothetical protein